MTHTNDDEFERDPTTGQYVLDASGKRKRKAVIAKDGEVLRVSMLHMDAVFAGVHPSRIGKFSPEIVRELAEIRSKGDEATANAWRASDAPAAPAKPEAPLHTVLSGAPVSLDRFAPVNKEAEEIAERGRLEREEHLRTAWRKAGE